MIAELWADPRSVLLRTSRKRGCAAGIDYRNAEVSMCAMRRETPLRLVHRRSEGYRVLTARNHATGAAGPRSQQPGMAFAAAGLRAFRYDGALSRQDVSTEQLALIADRLLA